MAETTRTRWFRVTTTNWGCEIKPIVVTKETEKTIWHEGGVWKGSTIIRKSLKHSCGCQYFHHLSDAKARATEYCNKKYDYHIRRAADFEQLLEEALEVQYD